MSRVFHAPEAMEAAARHDDPRQRWARDITLVERDDVFLNPLQIDHFREGARAGRYICPIVACAQPLFFVRVNRHVPTFYHRPPFTPDANHSPESLLHRSAKNVLGQWLRSHYPEPTARVVIDHEAVDNGQIPDVNVQFADGRRFAFEVQCAGLSPARWLERHQGYAAQGITDVWLFGQLRSHWQHTVSDDSSCVREVPLFELMRAQGVPVRWFDPDQQVILTGRDETARYRRWTDSGTRLIEYQADPLARCRIAGTRFVTPTDDAEHAAIQVRRREEMREAASQRRTEDWTARRAQRLQAAWDAFQRDRFPFGVPLAIAHTDGTDRLMWQFAPEHWHALVFERHIEGKIGRSFEFRHVAGPLAGRQRSYPKGVFKALSRYLLYLRDQGFLQFRSDRELVVGPILVVADLAHPPMRPPSPKDLRSTRIGRDSPGHSSTPQLAQNTGSMSLPESELPQNVPQTHESQPRRSRVLPVEPAPALSGADRTEVFHRFIRGKSETQFWLRDVVNSLGGRWTAADVIRYLMELHRDGWIGEPGVQPYYGGPISVRSRTE